MSHFLFVVALLVAMYTPLSTYRTPYFIAATFVVVALHQILATQEPPPEKMKKSVRLDLAIVDRILQEDEITIAGDIVTKPKAAPPSDTVEGPACDNTEVVEEETEGKSDGEVDDIRGDDNIRGEDDDIRNKEDDDIRGEGDNFRGEDDNIRKKDDDIRGEDDDFRGEDDNIRKKDDDIRGEDDDFRREDDREKDDIRAEEQNSVVEVQSTRKRKGKKARKVD